MKDMASRLNNPFILLEQVSENPTWGEPYPASGTDWQFADDPEVPEPTAESEWEDFSPEKKPLDPSDDQWWFPEPSSRVDLLPSPSVPFSTPASPWATPMRAPRTRSSWRRARGAAAYRPYKTNGDHSVRASIFRRLGRGRGSNCGRWRYMPDICRPMRYMPHCTSLEHIPVVIQATKWYQVVGSTQCSHCSDQGRHQMTSWMCQSCQVPLCLMPYRNCYAKWHSQWC